MSKKKASPEPPAKPRRQAFRRVVSVLIDTGPVWDGTWKWTWRRFLAIVGPGSVPLAYILTVGQFDMVLGSYHVAFPFLLPLIPGAALVLARWRPISAWFLSLVGIVWVALASHPFDPADALLRNPDQMEDLGSPPFMVREDPYSPHPASEIVIHPYGGELWPVSPNALISLMIVQFALARRLRVATAVGSWVTFVGLMTVLWYFADYRDLGLQHLATVLQLTALATVIGITVRLIGRSRARVAEEEKVSQAERWQRQVLEERARIARELHDIVAHHMSVISVQASTAEYRIPGLEEAVREEFRSIAGQARHSLSEMRRLLSVLRNDDEGVLREPQPSAEGIEELAESVRRSGTPVETLVSVDLAVLPESLSLLVYRIVQEALSNVVRHAPGADTTVAVGQVGRTLHVRVENGDPPGLPPSADPQAGSGLGLVGMRERVALHGGTLETGSRGLGGFTVAAELPVDDD
ncbi:sensor histidine kinase [Salininema proteolyticum]|uniref:histidine kinase n=1 Tax=Salininema proteolyticum TaxID=1607685 RepID=A0ABV8U469_9ACTN